MKKINFKKDLNPYNKNGSYKKYIVTYMPKRDEDEDEVIFFFKSKKAMNDWMLLHCCTDCLKEIEEKKYGNGNPFGTACGCEWNWETIQEYVHSKNEEIEAFNPVGGWYFPNLNDLKTKITREELL